MNTTSPGKTMTTEMLIGALLRVPAQVIQQRIIRELNAVGFDGLTMAHMPVLQYPGPDRVRPGTLAERAGMSKQAMNRLLGTLEELGYVARSDSPEEGRARMVRFTKRGHAVYAKILDILHDIEREWSAELGSREFHELKKLLMRVKPTDRVGVEIFRPSATFKRRAIRHPNKCVVSFFFDTKEPALTASKVYGRGRAATVTSLGETVYPVSFVARRSAICYPRFKSEGEVPTTRLPRFGT